MSCLWLHRRVAVPLVIALLVAAACGTGTPAGGEREVACSVGGSIRFPESFLQGPDQSRDRLAATVIGRVLDDFFMAGPGVDENDRYRDAEGFSPVSGTLVLGYVDGSPASYFTVEDGRVSGWGGCSPNLVEGDLVAVRWQPVQPVDLGATALSIEIFGDGCSTTAGTEIISEVVRIDVTETDGSVTIVAWTRTASLVGTCDEVAVLIGAQAQLATPLGDRTLLDGGTVPPTPVAIGN
jgi:hypothetical protein